MWFNQPENNNFTPVTDLNLKESCDIMVYLSSTLSHVFQPIRCYERRQV